MLTSGEWIKPGTRTVQSAVAEMDFPVCNLIVLNCQDASQWPAWNADICLRVCPCRMHILWVCACMPMRAWVTVCNVCIPTFSVSDRQHVCVSLAFLDGGTLYACTEFFQHPLLFTHTHTNIHHTSFRWHARVTTATRNSQRLGIDRGAETTILAGQRL